MWQFVQRTGNLYHNGVFAWQGFAGNGAGLNNPAMENAPRIGPLPCGMYTVAAPYHHARLGPDTMNLEPDITNEMFGRSKFRVHGISEADAKHGTKTSSEGCICKSPAVARLQIWNSGDHRLQVIAEESDVTHVSRTDYVLE